MSEENFYAAFDENGWHITAYLPYQEPYDWKVVAKRGEEEHTFSIPMVHEPRFGPDIEDCSTLEKVTDEFLKNHP